MAFLNSKLFLTLIFVATNVVSIEFVSACKPRDKSTSNIKNAKAEDASLLEIMSEIKQSLARVDKIYADVEANPSRLKRKGPNELSDNEVVQVKPNSNPAQIQIEKYSGEILDKKSPYESKFAFDDSVILLDEVIANLSSLKEFYPDWSDRFLKEIDLLNENSFKLRSIIGLPPPSNSNDTSLQLEENKKVETTEPARGQLSALDSKIKTAESQAKGETTSKDGTELKALWKARSDAEQKIRIQRMRYEAKKFYWENKLRSAINAESWAIKYYNESVVKIPDEGIVKLRTGEEMHFLIWRKLQLKEIERLRSVRKTVDDQVQKELADLEKSLEKIVTEYNQELEKIESSKRNSSR